MSLPSWVTPDKSERDVQIFRDHGVGADIYVAKEIDPTEAVFVISPVATFPKRDLTHALRRGGAPSQDMGHS